MTTATEFEWDNLVDEYVLRQVDNAGWPKITWTSTNTPLNTTYCLLPYGAIDVIVTWDGEAEARIYYLPDGSYDSRQIVGKIAEADAFTPRTRYIPLAIDTENAKLFISVAGGQSDYTAGVKIIKSTIDVKEV